MPEEWIEFPYCDEMESYAQNKGGLINDVWRNNTPESEDILTKDWGYQHVVGQRGEWAVKQLLDQWGIEYEQDKIYSDRGDKFDFNIPGFGTLDSKNSQIHDPDKSPTEVHVKAAQIRNKPVDYYVFCKIHTYHRKLWVLGYGRRIIYDKMAKLYKPGDYHPDMKIKRPVKILSIKYLYPMSYLRDLLPVKPKYKSKERTIEVPQLKLF